MNIESIESHLHIAELVRACGQALYQSGIDRERDSTMVRRRKAFFGSAMVEKNLKIAIKGNPPVCAAESSPKRKPRSAVASVQAPERLSYMLPCSA